MTDLILKEPRERGISKDGHMVRDGARARLLTMRIRE
jgi:hypothetical protein